MLSRVRVGIFFISKDNGLLLVFLTDCFVFDLFYKSFSDPGKSNSTC